MTTQQAIALYKTQMKLAAALGCAQSTIAGWGEYPPAVRQLQIERITRRRLRAEPDIFSKRRKAA